jgi:hypothetical protein
MLNAPVAAHADALGEADANASLAATCTPSVTAYRGDDQPWWLELIPSMIARTMGDAYPPGGADLRNHPLYLGAAPVTLQ